MYQGLLIISIFTTKDVGLVVKQCCYCGLLLVVNMCLCLC